MKAIVCVSENWGIGYQNQLLYYIPEDMKFFRDKTIHHTILMGRNTYESIGHALPDRTNLILSRNPNLADTITDATVITNMTHIPEDAYIIGGDSIYRQFLPYCKTVYVTKVYTQPKADRFFPNLDNHPDWIRTEQSPVKTYKDLKYQFLTYNKI